MRHQLISIAIDRLRQRRAIYALAKDVLEGLDLSLRQHASRSFVQESDEVLVCGSGNPEVKFSCNDKFDCNAIPGETGKFDCTGDEDFVCDTNTTFSDCGTGNDAFNCNVPTGYECGTEQDGVKVYSCYKFECSPPPAKYGCDEIDFFCGSDFDCKDDFDCVAGHVFGCTDDHDCVGDFSCAAKGDPRCGKTMNQYGRPDPDLENWDGNAGDFLCGWQWAKKDENGEIIIVDEGPDVFNCQDKFGCSSLDEFDCWVDTSSFSCGTGDAGDQFSCTARIAFECDKVSDFSCEPIANFECDRSDFGSYDCTAPSGKYTPDS